MKEQWGRFAPSPTGRLHLGNARTGLLAWLWARAEGGSFAMRVEDIDTPRVRPGLEAEQLEELRWLGLDWDGPVVRQSERTLLYEAAIRKLDVYECYCSRAEIVASAPHAGEEGVRYPGTCRALTEAQRAEGRRRRVPSLRLRAPAEPLRFTDELMGAQEFACDDFVLKRADGLYSYQLAVTVDDGEMGITQVLRGADLLPSTARQLVLHRALGLPPPRWAHVPLVHAMNGERLTKRDEAVSLSSLRARGEDPRQIVARLARLSGIEAEGPCNPAELIPRFSLQAVPRVRVLVAADGSG